MVLANAAVSLVKTKTVMILAAVSLAKAEVMVLWGKVFWCGSYYKKIHGKMMGGRLWLNAFYEKKGQTISNPTTHYIVGVKIISR